MNTPDPIALAYAMAALVTDWERGAAELADARAGLPYDARMNAAEEDKAIRAGQARAVTRLLSTYTNPTPYPANPMNTTTKDDVARLLGIVAQFIDDWTQDAREHGDGREQLDARQALNNYKNARPLLLAAPALLAASIQLRDTLRQAPLIQCERIAPGIFKAWSAADDAIRSVHTTHTSPNPQP